MDHDASHLLSAQRTPHAASQCLYAALALMAAACGSADADGASTDVAGTTSAEASTGPGTSGETTPLPCPTESGMGCAPLDARVDLYEPTFSNPTRITNPYFPISDLHTVVFIGHVDGAPFRTETTLLPETRVLEWNGQQIETLQSQYVAFSDGRIEEIATDWYAQADDGSVWYFGEDVADYDESGTIYTHEGTWLVGRDGAPLAMAMPAMPQLGNAWLAENIEPAAWEQITVVEVGVTMEGPPGPVDDIVVASEYKLDDEMEQKIFAPGYGEFSTGSAEDDNLEPLALAIPTDSVEGPSPEPLVAFASGTAAVFDAAGAGDGPLTAEQLAALTMAWESFRAGHQTPPLLRDEADRLLTELTAAVDAESFVDAQHFAIALGRVAYDFRLRHEPVSDVNRVRLDMWLAQIAVDASANDLGAIKGDIASAELVWDRIDHTFEDSAAHDVATRLAALRAAADDEDTALTITQASQLRAAIADVGWH